MYLKILTLTCLNHRNSCMDISFILGAEKMTFAVRGEMSLPK